MAINPLATFDCLYLGSRLQKQLSGFAPAELHLLCYLACLLGLYRARPQTDWGYDFVGTELGAPFSLEIDRAVKSLQEWGYFSSMPDCFQMTSDAEEKLASFLDQEMYHERSECLRAAGASILAFSVGTIREALGQQSELYHAKSVSGTRLLLEEPALDELYQNFGILRSALGVDEVDLRLPAVAWITALFQHSQEMGENEA